MRFLVDANAFSAPQIFTATRVILVAAPNEARNPGSAVGGGGLSRPLLGSA